MADKIPQDNKCPTTYMQNRILQSMVITPVVEDEVQSIIKSLKESSGWLGCYLSTGCESYLLEFYYSINTYHEYIIT